MTAVHDALRKRYAAPEWAYFEEVRNGTGYARKTARSADALAFALWPSRGLELHGFEVKVSRGDWLREKKDPAKADEISRFCDRWWLATDKGVVLDVGEVPPSWGWLELAGRCLVTRREAPVRSPEPLDRLMVASILRNASEAMNARIAEHVAARFGVELAAEREAQAVALARANARAGAAQEESRHLQAFIARVERALGFELVERWKTPATEAPGAFEKLAALGGRDLATARGQTVEAARLLRYAATSARLVLRAARGGAS